MTAEQYLTRCLSRWLDAAMTVPPADLLASIRNDILAADGDLRLSSEVWVRTIGIVPLRLPPDRLESWVSALRRDIDDLERDLVVDDDLRQLSARREEAQRRLDAARETANALLATEVRKSEARLRALTSMLAEVEADRQRWEAAARNSVVAENGSAT